jgi:hypothetical protein
LKDNSKLNQYCSIHRYVHKESYELCDYCIEHKHYCLYHKDKYYNYGFSKRKIAICKDCEDSLFGGGRYGIIIAHEPYNIHECICQVIKDNTTTTTADLQVIDYYEGVKIAYSNNKKLFEEYCGSGGISYDRINKDLGALWRFTYRFVNEEDRVKVVNRDPNNLLVSWVPGYYTEFDIPKSMLV